MKEKQIKQISNYDKDDLKEKVEITENLNENIVEYYEEYKDELEEPNQRVNITITDRDIMLNIIFV